MHIPVGSHSIYFPVGATFGAWDLPPGNWDGANLVGKAEFFVNGEECVIYDIYVMHYYVDGPKDPRVLKSYSTPQEALYLDDLFSPNPIGNGEEVIINISKDEHIHKVVVFDLSGQSVDFEQNHRSLVIKNREKGLYQILVITDQGKYTSSVVIK